MDEKTKKAWKELMNETFEENFIKWFNRGFEELISERMASLETGQEEIKDQLNNLDRKVDRFNANHEQRITKLEKVRGII